MELLIFGKNVTVNRYYTDKDVEGLRDVHYIGENKMILLGDDEALIQGYSINRLILKNLGE